MTVRSSADATVPAGYRLHGTVDLKRDRGQLIAIQVIAVLIVGAMVGPVLLLDLLPAGGWNTGVTIAVTVVACLLYGAVHELTHAAVLWCSATNGRPRPCVFGGDGRPWLLR